MESISHHDPRKEYPKLVRDNIPDIIKARTGVVPEHRIAESDAEFESFLLKKIVEEARELQYASEEDNLEEEYADIDELLKTLMELKSLKAEQIVALQKEKRERNGGFEKRIIMEQYIPKPNDVPAPPAPETK